MLNEKVIREKGHELAARYLERKGYEILEHDYECSAGHMDMIAMDPNNELVFVSLGNISDDIALAVAPSESFGRGNIRLLSGGKGEDAFPLPPLPFPLNPLSRTRAGRGKPPPAPRYLPTPWKTQYEGPRTSRLFLELSFSAAQGSMPARV